MTSQGETRQRLAGISRVDRALLQLHRVREQASAGHSERSEALLSSWRAKLSGRREQISDRLEIIEAHMERVAPLAEPSPRLAVVCDSGDSEIEQEF